MTKYRIRRRDEETECCYCGYPLFIDDTALMSKDEQNIYCSMACAGTDARSEARALELAGRERPWPAFGYDWR